MLQADASPRKAVLPAWRRRRHLLLWGMADPPDIPPELWVVLFVGLAMLAGLYLGWL